MSVGDGYLPLDTAAKQLVVKWLNSRSNEHNCPVCQKNDWSVGDYFMHGVLFSPNQPPSMAGGSAYPIVFLVCNSLRLYSPVHGHSGRYLSRRSGLCPGQ